MAWISPVINRSGPNTRTTYADMNRICGNINFLFGTSLKDDWTRADIVDRTTWDAIVSVVSQLAGSVGLEVNDSTDYVNLNAIEEVTLRRYALLSAGYKIPVRFNGVRLGERRVYPQVIVTFKTPLKFGGVHF